MKGQRVLVFALLLLCVFAASVLAEIPCHNGEYCAPEKVWEWLQAGEARATSRLEWIQFINKEFCKEDENVVLDFVEHRYFHGEDEVPGCGITCRVHYTDPSDGSVMNVSFSKSSNKALLYIDVPQGVGEYVLERDNQIEIDLTTGEIHMVYWLEAAEQREERVIHPYRLTQRVIMNAEEAVGKFRSNFNALLWLTTTGQLDLWPSAEK